MQAATFLRRIGNLPSIRASARPALRIIPSCSHIVNAIITFIYLESFYFSTDRSRRGGSVKEEIPGGISTFWRNPRGYDFA
jgi:hypothetical protein